LDDALSVCRLDDGNYRWDIPADLNSWLQIPILVFNYICCCEIRKKVKETKLSLCSGSTKSGARSLDQFPKNTDPHSPNPAIICQITKRTFSIACLITGNFWA
jgi:hypothetical protein